MAQSLCRLDDFKDNCGFGLIAHIKGNPSHKLLLNAIQALTCMTHRGGVAADGKTGDGCGLLLQKPDSFLRTVVKETLQIELPEVYAVGAVMLNTDDQKRATAKNILEQELTPRACKFLAGVKFPPTATVSAQSQWSRYLLLNRYLSRLAILPMNNILALDFIWGAARLKSS